jgi:Zn-dependent metalloprotease
MERNNFVQGDSRDKINESKQGENQDCSRALYRQLDSDRQAASALLKAASAKDNSLPAGFSIIPPYMLEALAQADKDNNGSANTYNKTIELQKQMLRKQSLADQPGPAEDFQGAREVYDAKATENTPGDKARFEGENPTDNKDVDDAYDLTGIVRDFYQKEYNRNSINGQGMKMVSTVNYGENFQNAFWNGSQMTYGHPGPKSPFKNFLLLDIAGHEITHGVTEKEVNFRYWGQSGALNESMSDVFGELIKQYSKNQNADEADWVVGDGLLKEGVNGRGIRDMLHPGTAYDDRRLGGKDPQPDNMKDYKQIKSDNAGVHTNSGIPNRAFALFATAVGGHAWEDPGHIWFEARKHSGNSPSFAQFAYQTIEAAKKIAHQSDEVEKLEQAWEEVGVTPSLDAIDTLSPQPEAGANPEALAVRQPARAGR